MNTIITVRPWTSALHRARSRVPGGKVSRGAPRGPTAAGPAARIGRGGLARARWPAACTRLLYGATTCLAILWAVQARAGAPILTAVASGHTADWNPVAARSYPALLVSRLICERLYERRCHSLQENRITNVVARCQSPDEQVREGGRVQLDLSRAACVDERGAPLTVDDVQFTLGAIAESKYSEYHYYDIRPSDGGLLTIGGGELGTGMAQTQKLDFPIVRRAGSTDPAGFARTRIDMGRIGLLDDHGAGPFAVNSVSPERINLVPRKPGSSPLAGVEITELALEIDKLDVLSRPDRPDIVLAVPEVLRYSRGLYEARQSEDLMSFTYVGFNFVHPSFRAADPPPQKDLIQNAEFRELFARSLWAIGVVRDKFAIGGNQVDAHGIFLGESFDPNQPQSPRLQTTEEVRRAIRNFIERQRLVRPVAFRMLISIAVSKHLTDSEVDALLVDLNAFWSPAGLPEGLQGVKIERAMRPTSPREFAEARDAGKYHLLFDDFVYGRNLRKQIAFVDPRGRGPGGENFLGIDVYKEAEVEAWLADDVRGLVSFRRRVAETYPVAVLGYVPVRDLFSKAIVRPREDCGDAQVMPYYNLSAWQLKRP